MEKYFTPKQLEMWSFTLDLIKDNYPNFVFDNGKKSDVNYLSTVLAIHLKDWVNKETGDTIKHTQFTLDEWFEYLNSVK